LKRYPKLVQCDKRGQIVIPKEMRLDLGIEEGTGFFMYSISEEGILLKKVEPQELNGDDPVVATLKEKAEKINLNKDKLDKTMDDYKKTKKGGLDLI